MSSFQHTHTHTPTHSCNSLPTNRNLPFKITTEELFEVFGKFGAIRQIRAGVAQKTKGTAYVVYEDIMDAKNAVDHLSGFNIGGRYIIVLYHRHGKGAGMQEKMDTMERKRKLEALKKKHGV